MKDDDILIELKKLNNKIDKLIQILSIEKNTPERSNPQDAKKAIEEKIRKTRMEAEMKLAELRKEKL